MTNATNPTPREKSNATSEPNEGEGNRTAARRYNKATEEYVKTGRSDEAAKRAAQALDGPEGEELRRAEEEEKDEGDVDLED